MHGADHIFAVFALDAQLFIGMGTDGDIHGIVLLLDLGDLDIRAHRDIGMYLDAGRKDMLDIPVQHILGQAVIGDAVAQHAAQLGPLLIHGYLVAHKGQIVGRRHAAGAAADHGHGFAGGRGLGARQLGFGIIHSIALEPADIHGIVHHAAAALAFARVLAHIGACRRERVILADQLYGIAVAPLADQRDIARDIHMCRAGRHTGHRVAQPADTAAVQHMFFVILAEAAHTFEHHVSGLVADGAVGRIGDHLGGILDQVDGGKVGRAVEHLLDEHSQLRKAHAAGHTLAAGLRVAQAQKIQGHIHRAQAHRACTDAAVHILMQVSQNRLRTARCFNGKSAHGISPPIRGGSPFRLADVSPRLQRPCSAAAAV